MTQKQYITLLKILCEDAVKAIKSVLSRKNALILFFIIDLIT